MASNVVSLRFTPYDHGLIGLELALVGSSTGVMPTFAAHCLYSYVYVFVCVWGFRMCSTSWHCASLRTLESRFWNLRNIKIVIKMIHTVLRSRINTGTMSSCGRWNASRNSENARLTWLLWLRVRWRSQGRKFPKTSHQHQASCETPR